MHVFAFSVFSTHSSSRTSSHQKRKFPILIGIDYVNHLCLDTWPHWLPGIWFSRLSHQHATFQRITVPEVPPPHLIPRNHYSYLAGTLGKVITPVIKLRVKKKKHLHPGHHQTKVKIQKCYPSPSPIGIYSPILPAHSSQVFLMNLLFVRKKWYKNSHKIPPVPTIH